MALSDVNSLSSLQNFIKSTDSFEQTVKTKLKWNKEQWTQVGENGSRFHKLCNSLRYWKEKLKPALESTSLILTIFNNDKDVRTSLFEILTEIEKVSANIKVQGFSDFRNPRYLCFYFKTEEEKEEVRKNFKMLNDNFVVYLSWALEDGPSTLTLKVHWLPMTMNLNVIKKELDKYVDFVEERRNVRTFMSGRELQSGKISFKVTVKKDIKVEIIPHLLEMGAMEALITIPGRAPLCLNCNNMGHISKDCIYRFCSTCQEMKRKEHTCIVKTELRSYAEAVKKKTDDEGFEPEDWGTDIKIREEASSQDGQSILVATITNLENQILKLDEQETQELKKRRNNKRKAYSVSSETDKIFYVNNTFASSSDVGTEWHQSSGGNTSTEDSEVDENDYMHVDSLDNNETKMDKEESIINNGKDTKLADLPKVGTKQKGTEQRDNKSKKKSYSKSSSKDTRSKEEKRFDKLLEGKREFIFKDE